LKDIIGEKIDTDKKGSYFKSANYGLRRCDIGQVE